MPTNATRLAQRDKHVAALSAELEKIYRDYDFEHSDVKVEPFSAEKFLAELDATENQVPAAEREPYPMWVDETFKQGTHRILAVAQITPMITYNDPREWVVLADGGEGEYQRYVTWRVTWNMGRYDKDGSWQPGFWNAYWGSYRAELAVAQEDFAKRAGFLVKANAEIKRLNARLSEQDNRITDLETDIDAYIAQGDVILVP